MRSLFVKIFFSFWLSTVLIVSLSVLTSERPRFAAVEAWFERLRERPAYRKFVDIPLS